MPSSTTDKLRLRARRILSDHHSHSPATFDWAQRLTQKQPFTRRELLLARTVKGVL